MSSKAGQFQVAEIGESAGLDPGELARRIEAPEIKDRLRAVTGAAVARGLAGVPTIDTGDALYWGDDQLEAAAAALRADR